MLSFANREPSGVNRSIERDSVLAFAMGTSDVATVASVRTPATSAGSHRLLSAHSSVRTARPLSAILTDRVAPLYVPSKQVRRLVVSSPVPLSVPLDRDGPQSCLR